MSEISDLRAALAAGQPGATDLDAAAQALVEGVDVATIRARWRPKAPSLSPPCRRCGAVGTVTITMQQLRSGDEAEEAVASCSRCRRRYRADL